MDVIKINKKASLLPVKFLISLIFAIILIFASFSFAGQFIKISAKFSEGEIQKIDETLVGIVHGSETGGSVTLRIPEEAGLFFFEPQASQVEYQGRTPYIFEKPSSCDYTNPCMCYCDKLIHKEESLIYYCKDKRLKCSSIAPAGNFQVFKDPTEFFGEEPEYSNAEFKGGVIIMRPGNFGETKLKIASLFGYPELSYRTRVYFEKTTTPSDSYLNFCVRKEGACS